MFVPPYAKVIAVPAHKPEVTDVTCRVAIVPTPETLKFLQPKALFPKSYELSTEGNISEIYLAKELIVSEVAFPNTPTPLNVKLPLITALPVVCNDAAFI